MHRETRDRSGLTLLEMIVFVALWGMLAVTTMAALGQCIVIRSRAVDRSALVMIAQQELDRLRLLPIANLSEGTEERSLPDWPVGTVATIETHRRADGTWMLDVAVERSTIEGLPIVKLTTLRMGGDA